MRRVLIIGAGISGATTADRLSRAGVEVHLVEKQATIGGHAREMGCKATDVCLRCNVCVASDTFKQVLNNPRIHVYTSASLLSLVPARGNKLYSAVISTPASGRKTIPLEVDAVVLATGHEPFNPGENAAYGYGSVANVITGMDAERQLAEKSSITRPSDGTSPKRVAFIQCVGSRTAEVFRRPEDTNYCSTVCCSYALRMARQVKHTNPGSEITVFYMDIQNFGRHFPAFFQASQSAAKFIRARPYGITAGPGDSVRVKYTPEQVTGQTQAPVKEDEFDMLVLSVGIRPAADNRQLADKLGLPLDDAGFFGIKQASALPDLQKKGIFVVGTGESPKDIAGCLAQADAVSTMILSGTDS